MTGTNVGILALVGVGALLVLAGGAAGQTIQAVQVSIEAEEPTQPDSLPGTYRTSVEVTVRASGGACLCQETEVTMQAAELGPADGVSFDPSAYTIDWTMQAAEGSAVEGSNAHTTNVTAAIDVPGTAAADGTVAVSANATHSPSEGKQTQVDPADVPISLPDDARTGPSEDPSDPSGDEPSSTGSPNGGAPTNDTPSGDDGDDAGEDDNGVPGPGAGLGALAVTLAALAARTRT